LEDYPQLVFVEHFGRILSKPIVFIFLLILIGKGGSKLTHRCLLSRHQRQSGHAEEPIPHWISGIIILVWLFALGIASEAVGLDWVSDVGGVIVRLVGTILGAIVWLVVGGLIAAVLAYAFSHEGRELTLSLLGGLWYLTKDPTKPDKDRRFDLGDGKCGKIQTVRLLHTIFTADDGKQEIRPNALAMRQHYHWAGTSK